jgi:hypothetical protein
MSPQLSFRSFNGIKLLKIAQRVPKSPARITGSNSLPFVHLGVYFWSLIAGTKTVLAIEIQGGIPILANLNEKQQDKGPIVGCSLSAGSLAGMPSHCKVIFD